MPLLITENLTKTYGRRRGVRDVNLQLEAGEIFGFLGPNGAGKSTTIRLLLGFLKADSGTATVFGSDCWRHSSRIKQQVGYVPGDVRLYPWLTAREAFRIVGGVRKQSLDQPGMVLAEQFALEPDLPVRKMSRGNRQKLGLVLALVHRPKLIILDEPTSGLDPLMQDTLVAKLRELANEGCAVFFSSHTLSEVETLCDRIAIVREGQIVADTDLETLKSSAPRKVELVFQTAELAAACQLPTLLTARSRQGKTMTASLIGPAAGLLHWASQQPLRDLSIGQPNLETLFRRYYSSSAEGSE